MKVLWLVNIPLPEVSAILNRPVIPFGGWLVNTSQKISECSDIELLVAFPEESLKRYERYKGKSIYYIAFSKRNASKSFEQILENEKPDLVHIFGTEFPHTLDMIKACESLSVKYVISIQGLVSCIARYYLNGLPDRVTKAFTIRDLIKYDNITLQQKKFQKNGLNEIESIKIAKNVIGRTQWDKANVYKINPNITYFHCNETLREAFYKGEWKYEDCEKFSIFLSQGSYPIKGLHYMLEAMVILKRKYPVKLYVSGMDITRSANTIEKFKISSYGKYIRKLIEKYNLNEDVQFLGILDEDEMYKRYLKTNVFVCPSTIENSPNSLGEAMLLGVPSVASNVGGIPDLLEHKTEGFLYQSDAPEMLAHYVENIFNEEINIRMLSLKSREKALKIYDPEKNLQDLLNIYKSIIISKEY